MKHLYVILVFLLTACGTVPVDTTPAPIDNGLWTLELRTETKVDVGLMSDFIGNGSLSFPVIKDGRYSVRSERCNYNNEQNYSVDGIDYITLDYQELVKDKPTKEFACIFNIQVFVNGFDKGIQGQFLLARKDFPAPIAKINGRTFDGLGYYQFRENDQKTSVFTELTFELNKPGTTFFAACGNKNSKRFTSNPSWTLFELGYPGIKNCVYDIAFKFDDGTTALFTFNMHSFSKVIDVPTPVIQYKKGKLTLKAPSPVAAMATDGVWETTGSVSNEVALKKTVSPDEVIYVKIITANGRYKLLGIKNGVVVWTPSIVY
jgi:hypothetical protein